MDGTNIWTGLYMGEISQGVQSLNLMSYLSGVLGPFFGDLGLCYGKFELRNFTHMHIHMGSRKKMVFYGQADHKALE